MKTKEWYIKHYAAGRGREMEFLWMRNEMDNKQSEDQLSHASDPGQHISLSKIKCSLCRQQLESAHVTALGPAIIALYSASSRQTSSSVKGMIGCHKQAR